MLFKDAQAFRTLYSKSWGCSVCFDPANDVDYDPDEQYPTMVFSYATFVGYDGIPSHEELKKEDIYFQRNCDANWGPQIGLNSTKVTGTVFHFQHIVLNEDETDFSVVSCNSKYKNCAMCSNYEPYGCRICIDGYSLTTYKDSAGQD